MKGKRLKILVSCLNWGIGHASRMLSLIHVLENRGHDLIISGDGKALNFLRKELPGRKFVRIKDVNVNYHPNTWRMGFRLFNLGIKLRKIRRKEHLDLHKLNYAEQFDLVLSDNRYGMFLSNVYSILITHQLSPRAPIGGALSRSIINEWVKDFNEVWVPDSKGINLSGELSAGNHQQKKYIGILSRFNSNLEITKTIDYLFLLSGPEPLRTSFEEKILNQIDGLSGQIVLVRGTNKPHDISQKGNLTVINLAHSEELEKLLCSSKQIICRSGYSTLMDLIKLNLSAFIVPTPNQWEQEYLANYLKKKQIFNSCTQIEFEMKDLSFYSAPNIQHEDLLLKEISRVESILLKG